MDGEILEAIEMVQRLYPTVVKDQSKLLFHLKCRHFIELVAQNSSKMHDDNDGLDEEDVDGKGNDDSFLGKILHLGKDLYENFSKDESNMKILEVSL